MGKSQTKKKTAGRRHNPMRVPDAHLGQGKVVDGAKEQQMVPVLKKLRSAEYADRTWACAAVCNLIQNDAATRRMFQSKNVVGELIERLSDNVDEVVVEASGALRNLAIDGGYELCGEIFNKGVMSHLTVLMGKISNTITSILTSDPAQAQDHSDADLQARKHLLSLSENVISLIWCLAEANHKTLAAVNAANVHGLLVKVVEGRKIVGPGVALAAAQAMYSLSQDNRPFTSALMQHPTAVPSIVQAVEEDHSATEAELAKREAIKNKRKEANGHAVPEQGIADGRPLLMRVSLAGALRNIIPVDSPAGDAIEIKRITNETILPLVNSLLDVDLSQIAGQVEQLVNQVTSEARPPTETKAGKVNKDILVDHRSSSELALERIERMLSTVVVGLEVLTGICAGVEDTEDADAEGAEAGAGADDEEDEDEFVREDDEAMEDGIIGGIDRDEEDGDVDVLAEAAAHADALMGENGESGMEGDDIDGLYAIAGAGARLSSSVTLSLPHLLSLSIPSRLASLASLNPLSFPPSTSGTPSIHPPTTAMLSTLHLRALEALNNLLLTVAAALPGMNPAQASQLQGQLPLQGMWDGLMQLVQIVASEPEVIKERGQEMRGEVVQMAVGCAWGVAKIGADSIEITPDTTQLLISLPTLLPSQSPLALSRLLELLSTLASRQSVSNDENRAISSLLFSLFSQTITASASTPAKAVQTTSDQAETVIALINAIIDIYADETRAYDQVFEQEGCTGKLSDMVPGARACVRKVDRKIYRELRGKGEEAVGNLAAFVQYRKALRR